MLGWGLWECWLVLILAAMMVVASLMARPLWVDRVWRDQLRAHQTTVHDMVSAFWVQQDHQQAPPTGVIDLSALGATDWRPEWGEERASIVCVADCNHGWQARYVVLWTVTPSPHWQAPLRHAASSLGLQDMGDGHWQSRQWLAPVAKDGSMRMAWAATQSGQLQRLLQYQ